MNGLSQQIAGRVEELLREQLEELGVQVATLPPHVISESMRCEVYPDESMVYSWQGTMLLRVEPERDDNGEVVRWRMFTRDDEVPQIQ